MSAFQGRQCSERGCILFDHLVGEGEQLVGNLQVERLRSLEIDDQLKLCWQHNRQITRLLAFEMRPA